MNAMVKSTSRVLNIVCQMNEVIMFSVRDNHKRRCGSEVSTTCVSGRINESTSGPGAWLSLAALPPDVRKGFAFPIPIEEFRGSARIVRRSPRSEIQGAERKSLSAHQLAKPPNILCEKCSFLSTNWTIIKKEEEDVT